MPAFPTSFPGSLILPPPEVRGGRMREPGNEVAVFDASVLLLVMNYIITLSK